MTQRGLPLRAGIESQVGLIAAAPAAMEKKKLASGRQTSAGSLPAVAVADCFYTEEVRAACPENMHSAKATAMTVASGPNSRLRNTPAL